MILEVLGDTQGNATKTKVGKQGKQTKQTHKHKDKEKYKIERNGLPFRLGR